jgi:predicted permease
VSDDYWRRALDGDSAAIGRTLVIRDVRYTIVGIMRRGFTGVELDAADVWLPFAAFAFQSDKPWWENRNVNGFQVLVRSRAGAPWAMIDAALTRAVHRPELLRVPADTLQVARTGSIIRARGPGEPEQELRIAARLGGVAVVVLLIAIANVVNLLLSRAVRRRQEIAVRLALGISRRRLVRLLVSESVLLSLVAGAAALVAAAWGGALVRSLLLPDVHWAATPLHWRVLLFSLLLALAGGVAAGLVPALQAADPDLTDALKNGAREGSTHRSRLRGVLVVTQVALSTVLLVGAALFLESLTNVRDLDIGFDARRLVFAEALFTHSDSLRDAALGQTLEAIAQRLRHAPGVQQVALTSLRPMYGFSIEKYFPDADTLAHTPSLATFAAVSPEYFSAAGLHFVRGAAFGKSARAVVINRAMADDLWPGENAVGRCIRFARRDAPCFTVAGIVETSRRDNVVETPKPQYWVPLGAEPFGGYPAQTLVIRADPAAQGLVMSEVRRELVRAIPGVRPRITRMSEDLEPQYRPWEVGATLFTLFGVLALVVAAVGIYSTISYGVSQRMHEFGVRVALGARMRDIAIQVVASGVRTVLLGVLAGAAMAIAGGRLIASLLYGVQPGDARVLISVSLGVVAIAVAAALIPAWRAARVDPLTALRAER